MILTKDADIPAEAMLYAAGIKDKRSMKNDPHVGIASVWWEGNPCMALPTAIVKTLRSLTLVLGNNHLLALGQHVKAAVEKSDMIGWQYNTIGVSDAITMGGEGMRFSLQTREIIADSIETVTCAQFHDACIAIPGCDKNMPGAITAFSRHNRPSIMIYGGTIKPGYSETLRKPINISTCYEAHGAFLYDTLKSEADPSLTKDDIMSDIEQHACPGSGACGGMVSDLLVRREVMLILL